MYSKNIHTNIIKNIYKYKSQDTLIWHFFAFLHSPNCRANQNRYIVMFFHIMMKIFVWCIASFPEMKATGSEDLV